MNTEKLKFHKMWEAADTFVFDIDTGSILPILKTLPKISSYGDKHFLFYYEKGIGAAYYEEGEMRKAAQAGLKDFSDISYQKRYFSEIKDLLDRETRLYQKIEETEFLKLTDVELKDLLQQSIDVVVENFGFYLACQPQCVSLIEKDIQEKLSKVVPENMVIEAFTLLSTPTSSTKIRIEEQDCLNLLLRAKERGVSGAEKQAALRQHYKSYYLISAADGHEPWDLQYFQDKFNRDVDRSVDDIKKQLSSLDAASEKIKSQKTEFINKHNIPKDIIDNCNLLAEIGHWRLEMRFVWMPGYYYDKHILNEVSRRFNADKKLIRFATIAEIMKLFDGGSLDDRELIKRSDAFLFVIEDGQTFVLSGNEARSKMGEYVPATDNSSLKEFRGNIAMKGAVTANALVYKWGDNMQERINSVTGDFILVAGQTRPQLMPLIVKCKGIVTDEGGITSHAAIVSRELGIPCIIGTKIATQVVKDGDLIEVDANRGIVKILTE